MTTHLSSALRSVESDAAAAPVRLVVVNAGVSDPSSSRLLADRTAQKAIDLLREGGTDAVVSVIELGPLAVEIAQAIVSGFPGERVQAAIERLAGADAVIASTPVYKAGMSGLFKSFVDLLDNDLLIATPIVLAATAGTARHAMVVDEQLRPLFAFLRAIPVPTSLFAAPEDWGSSSLGERIERAATELVLLLRSGVGRSIADHAWAGYQHQFSGNATRAERDAADVDFDTDLMSSSLKLHGATTQSAGGHRPDPDLPGGVGDYQRQLFALDGLALLVEMALEQVELLGTEVVPVLRKEMAARRAPGVPHAPTHASLVTEKYGDAEPRQPRPNPNRGDNLSGASPYQDSDPDVEARFPLAV